MEACQRGDAAAADALVAAYWDRLYAYAYRLTLNQTDAEDLAQETIYRAFSRMDSFEKGRTFHSWLLRIATNVFLDAKKSPRAAEVLSSDFPKLMVKSSNLPEALAGQHELLEALWEVIRSLPREQQVVLQLRAMEHLDYAQIAEILNLKEPTARWQMHEARRTIRRKLSSRFDLEALDDEL